jgi:hypothetical protein
VSARVWLIYGWGGPDTVAAYLETWTSRHPRPERTSAKYEQRISRVLDVKVDGRPLADCRLRDLRRRHALALVDHLLVEQHAFNPADKARRSFALHVVAPTRRAILATSWLLRRSIWLCDSLVQRLPKPKVAGSRPVFRFLGVAGICTDSQGLAAGFSLLKR